jgi:UDP-glucuronate 4-epimerase
MVNDYYDPEIKEARLKVLQELAIKMGANYHFIRKNLADQSAVKECFAEHKFDRVVHLAAQAGVRHSIENPMAYFESNLLGFGRILEACRTHKVTHLLYASSSSVYGQNDKIPFSEDMPVAHPVSLYAATKKSNELLAHSYSSLYHLPTTGVRLFTVYGPWGRPDMALFLFTKNILAGKPIDVFNYGKHRRDFTYIDDIVEGVIRVLDNPPQGNSEWSGAKPDPATSKSPYQLYNIGNNNPVELMDYIRVLEENLGKKAVCNMLPLQDGDVPDTYADVEDLVNNLGYKPETTIETGIRNFVDWYRGYYD